MREQGNLLLAILLSLLILLGFQYFYEVPNAKKEIEKLLNRNGYSLFQFNSVLDFGCGDGRLTKHLFELIPNATIYGCDIVWFSLMGRAESEYASFMFLDPTNKCLGTLSIASSTA